ncbi:MAG: YqaJ viral recombinase family protein [Chlamydiota bacterium]|nr:YqaJ viral recombinase family protein [Chlamydiota bacterium]
MKHLQQNTNEWLEFRRSKIGSSDAPIIMGKSPWKTPHQLWEEKMGIKDSFFESQTMRRGKDLESEARKAFEAQTGLVVWPDVLTHNEHDFIIASMDGITMDGGQAVEIKCPGDKTHSMALQGIIPEHYQIQMQHQLAVAGLKKMFYYSFDGTQGILLELERDEQLIQELIQKEKEFYKYILDNDPPYNQRTDELWQAYAKKWKSIQNDKRVIEVEEKKCREALIELAGEKTSQGSGIRVTKYSRKGRVAYEKVPELKMVDLEKYRQSTTEAWRISEIVQSI